MTTSSLRIPNFSIPTIGYVFLIIGFALAISIVDGMFPLGIDDI